MCAESRIAPVSRPLFRFRPGAKQQKGMVSSDAQIAGHLEKWSAIALEEGWVESWLEGAIFPCEMAFLLAICEKNDIRLIFESGRQDGYSTGILGKYADHHGADVYSIDFEHDTKRARACRARLDRYLSIHLQKGDSFHLMGKAIRSHHDGPAAVLVDGPKGYRAISLLLASAAFPWVRVIALHNLDAELTPPERGLFQRLSPQPSFYEEFSAKAGGFFANLKIAERDYCSSVGAVRSLEHSSLGVMQVADTDRRRLLLTTHRAFGRYQPLFLHWKWRLQSYLPLLERL